MIDLYRIKVEIKKGSLMGLQMLQIFSTPQILCLHIIIIYLILICTETLQHDWKVIEDPLNQVRFLLKRDFRQSKKNHGEIVE